MLRSISGAECIVTRQRIVHGILQQHAAMWTAPAFSGQWEAQFASASLLPSLLGGTMGLVRGSSPWSLPLR